MSFTSDTHINPAETGFYYLESRYYDPKVDRWLNADGYITTGQGVLSYNMFAYCGNNPVNRTDQTGMKWWDSVKSTVNNAWNKVKTWVSKTLGINSKTTTTTQIMSQGRIVKVKGGVKSTTLVNKKKKTKVPITIYTSQENTYSLYGQSSAIGGGIKNEWNNTDLNIGTDGISYSKSFEILMGETSTTYSLTADGDIEYEVSGSICWDNTEFTTYISMSSKWQIVAVAGAVVMGKTAAIPIVIPLLSGAR